MKEALLILVTILVTVLAQDSKCFPLTRQWGGGPNGTSLNHWWCSGDLYYGFLGFSLPVEDDCNYDYNGFLNEFKKMKNNYNATFVRLYLPTCMDTSFWVNMIKAARDTSMALIPMIFWDWGQNDPVMEKAENTFLGVFNSEVADIAAYIIHSVAFGDELGEQGDYWLSRMKDFKSKLMAHSVNITITDDWDRDVYKNGNSLSDFGKQVNSLSDLTNAHVQPYYHPDPCPDAWHCWPYMTEQFKFLVANNKRPIFISQTMWAYNGDGHHRGEHDEADNMDNYQQYWNTINNNCPMFKSMGISWFFHTWNGEPGFDLINDSGNPVYPFVPKFC